MKEKKIKIEGTFIYFDKENRNARIYPKKLAREIMNQCKRNLEQGNMIGELGFPNRPEVSLANVSHRITDVFYNEKKNSLDGIAELLDTPSGIKAKNILKQNPKAFVVRSRGTGTINDKTKEVENYTLFSFDLVSAEEDPFKDIENECKQK